MAKPQISGPFVIVGQTSDGKRFRPSDWAERLCGVMSQYRPGKGAGGHLGYSPYVMPGVRDGGVKCVRVDDRLFALEPLAYRFLVGFAWDNDLLIEQSAAPAGDDQQNSTVVPITTG